MWKKLRILCPFVVGVLLAGTSPAIAQSGIEMPLLWSAEILGVGHESAVVGDIDDDGFDDAVVWDRTPSLPNPHVVGVYFGSAVGLEDEPTGTLISPLHPEDSTFGYSLESAGDVNGDGHADLIVGAPYGKDISGAQLGSGRAYVFHGNDNGLSNSPDWTGSLSGPTRYGHAVTGVGDVDGDGYSDVVVGDPALPRLSECLQGQSGSDSGDGGRVRLYSGSSTGLNSSASWEMSWENSNSQAGACLGYAVSGLGDVNDDGFDDFAVAAPTWVNSNEDVVGKVFVYYGSSSGPSATADWSISQPGLATNSNFTPTPGYLYGLFGWSIDGGGDVNGDGYDDLLIGGRGHFETESGATTWGQRAFIFEGSSSGLSSEPIWTVDMKGGREATLARLSKEVSLSGDVNADGYDDVVLPFAAPMGTSEHSRLALYAGSNSGPAGAPAWTFDGRNFGGQRDHARVGDSIRLGGDFDDDGHDDLLAHAYPQVAASNYGSGLHVFTGGPNPAPVAQAQSVSVRKGDTVEVALEASDPFGDPLTYAISVSPEEGSLSGLDDQQGTVTYEAPAAFVGDDPFEFEVEDDKGGTDTATVDVTVTNGAPIFEQPAASASYETVVGTEVTFPIEVSEPDGDSVTRRAPSVPDGASIEWDDGEEPGEFSWTPSADQTGETQVVLEADDTFEVTTRTVTIAVEPRDSDGDGVPDPEDACPNTAADTDDGCPPGAEPDPMADAGVDNDTGSQPDDERETQTSGCGCGTQGPASGGGLPMSVVWIVVAVGLWRARGNREWGIGNRRR